ncbi:MAG: SagB family peptide dehydrogenase [Streptosporangiaceae bacterium]|nr:SagB family peptide dehydrogenase [Streptosporangiaceae bacterium]
MTPDLGNGGQWGAELWSLREDVQVQPDSGDDLIQLRSHWGDIIIQRPAPVVREALRRMLLGPISLENVIGARNGPAGHQAAAASLALLHQVLDRLQPLVIRTLGIESGQPLLSVVPLTPQSRFRPAPIPTERRVRLSTFAQLGTDGREYRLESPLSLHRVLLHRPEALALLGSLSRPVAAAVSMSAWPYSQSLAADALAYLAAIGMVVGADDEAEDRIGVVEGTSRAGWSPADLMFHTRSNIGRHDLPTGRTYPMGHNGSPEPVVRPRSPDMGFPLHRPTWEALSAEPPLAVIMEGRRSMRRYGAAPVTAEELGDLLYRAARVRSLILPSSESSAPAPGQTPDRRLSDRPYPGGGACYELELYVTVGNCSGLSRGMYHYDPLGHSLEPVNKDHRLADRLLRAAADAAAIESPPPVLITMTARFRRLSWKYEGIAYSTVLKDVGVLLQNLYLVCTAMGLAPCALGSVNLELTARAFGTDWRLEPSVGQFMLGRAPTTPPASQWHWEPANDAQWAEHARAILRAVAQK